MTELLPRSLQIVLVLLVGLAFALSWAAKQVPEVRWLQSLRLPEPSEEQRRRLRRRQERIAGAELVLWALLIPLGYFALELILFVEPTWQEILVVGGLSLLCLVAGVVALARRR
jgi:hypothetical protein